MNKRFDKNGIMVDNMTSDELEIKRGDKLGVQGIHSGWELKYSPYIAIEFSGFDNLPITLPMMDLIIDEDFYELGCLVETEKGIFNIKCKSKDAVRLMKENINECFS